MSTLVKCSQEINLSFLPIGRAQENIDQAISCTSRLYGYIDAVTMSDMHLQLGNVFNDSTAVTVLYSVPDIPGIFQNTGNIRKDVPPFSHLQYFKLVKRENNVTGYRVRDSLASNWR